MFKIQRLEGLQDNVPQKNWLVNLYLYIFFINEHLGHAARSARHFLIETSFKNF